MRLHMWTTSLIILSCFRLASATPLNLDNDKNITDSHLVTRDTDDSGDGSLSKRAQVPSTDDIVALIDRGGIFGGKPSIFWTALGNPQGYSTARNWGIQKFGARCNFYLYTDCLADSDYRNLKSLGLTGDDDQLLINHFSKAFARRSVNTAYVLFPDGVTEPGDDSIWKIWEAPTLTRRPDWVVKIVRVNVPSNVETTIWTRPNDPLYEPAPPGK